MKLANVSLLLLAFCIMSGPLQAATQSSYQMIESAYNNGQLNSEQRLLYLVQSIRDQQALPVRFQSDVKELQKSATEIFMEVHDRWDQLSQETQQLLQPLLARPSSAFSVLSPSGTFRIHYNTSGVDAVPTTDVNPNNGVPDYVDWIGDYIDSCYRSEVTNLGHLPPPSDFSGGGDSRYDIYTEDMPYYGYTQPEGPGDRAWNDYYSYVSIENNFSGFPSNDDPDGNQKGAMKVTLAHEFYHAIQMGYEVNFSADTWFMEESSTWMEEWTFSPVNDNYNYLNDWFAYPYYSLHSTTGLHPYGGFLWPKYLEERFGGSVMQEIWAHTISSTPYNDLAVIIANHGSTLEDEFSEFCAWNFITGSRNDGLHFEDGSDYPLLAVERSHASFPVSGQSPNSSHRPDAMAFNAIRFYLPSGPGTFTINYNGDDTTPWRVKILKYTSTPTDTYAEDEMTLDGNGDGTYVVNDPENWTQVIMIPVNISQTLNDRNYVYGATWLPYTGYDIDINWLTDDTLYSATWTNAKFEVTNTGVQPDNFTLHASDVLGWTVSASPSSVYLTPGQVDTVGINATCPPATNEGVVDQLILTADASSAIGVTDADTCNLLVLVQRGDADNSGSINVTDGVYIITYVFVSGPTPIPIEEAGDANCDGLTNITDAVFILQYIFAGGPLPPCNPF